MGLDDKMKTWFGTMTFDSKHCFLCGELLDENNSTVEHIFPKWLQHKHGLWDQTLRLPNGSHIKYKQLIVPCCKKCNNEHLSSMEKSVREALDSGIEKVKELDKTIIYKWVIKIIYCLLFKELSLKEDIKSRDSKMIITPEFLKNYSVMFDYMQSIMGNIKINENMSSVFIFNVLSNSGNDPKRDFFYIDDILHAQFAIRSNEIGIICSLGDTEAIKYRFRKYFKPFYEMKLHEIQFRQLIAEVFYCRTLLKGGSSMIFMPNEIVQIPPAVNNYDEYNNKNYAAVLYLLLHQFEFKFEQLYSEELDAVLNLLVDQNKRIIVYDQDGKYHLGKKHTGYNAEVFENVNGGVILN